MNNFEFEGNDAGIQALLKSEEIQAILQDYADEVTSKAGTGYKDEMKIGQKRAYITIRPETDEAVKDNYKNNTLLRSLG